MPALDGEVAGTRLSRRGTQSHLRFQAHATNLGIPSCQSPPAQRPVTSFMSHPERRGLSQATRHSISSTKRRLWGSEGREFKSSTSGK